MSAAPTTRAEEATLRRLELTVRHRLDGLLRGEYAGLLPGLGAEPGDGRLYAPGDDVRRIDWNLTARSAETHVREPVAERELVTWLVVDASASLDFGSTRWEKRELATAVAAAFGLLTARTGNSVGALIVDDAGSRVLPPRSGRWASTGLLTRLGARPRGGSGAADLPGALLRVRTLARRRGLVVLISDLLGPDGWVPPLRGLTARHDVVVAHLSDPRDRMLPSVGTVTFVDPESGQRLDANTSDPRLRAAYEAAARRQWEGARAAVLATGAAHLPLATDSDWVADIVRFALRRRRRR